MSLGNKLVVSRSLYLGLFLPDAARTRQHALITKYHTAATGRLARVLNIIALVVDQWHRWSKHQFQLNQPQEIQEHKYFTMRFRSNEH
jgi:hypothetical protein